MLTVIHLHFLADILGNPGLLCLCVSDISVCICVGEQSTNL